MRGAWIEIGHDEAAGREEVRSLPMRGAWIEIYSCGRLQSRSFVAPHAGSVA